MKKQVPSILVPDDIFTERREGLFLVVTKHLKHDGLGPDVLNEGFSDFYSDLETKEGGSGVQEQPIPHCV